MGWCCGSRLSLWTTRPGNSSGLPKVDPSHTTMHRFKSSPRAAGATRVVWIADFLPDEAANNQQAAMETALQIMKTTLDRFAQSK